MNFKIPPRPKELDATTKKLRKRAFKETAKKYGITEKEARAIVSLAGDWFNNALEELDVHCDIQESDTYTAVQMPARLGLVEISRIHSYVNMEKFGHGTPWELEYMRSLGKENQEDRLNRRIKISKEYYEKRRQREDLAKDKISEGNKD